MPELTPEAAKSLGEKLLQRRRAEGKSPEQLADEIGVNRTTLREIEAGTVAKRHARTMKKVRDYLSRPAPVSVVREQPADYEDRRREMLVAAKWFRIKADELEAEATSAPSANPADVATKVRETEDPLPPAGAGRV